MRNNSGRKLAPPAQARLRGLPLTIKSSISVKGRRCEIGSLLRKGHISDGDAEAVARLRSNGAILAGTTNCPEFLMAYETDNLLYGKTSNPWDLGRSAGGSSGGEAAAIAAGLSAGGLGSDSGGSVREPAHFCGICSLKPTPGRVPGRGHNPPCIGPFSILGAIGPMARTIADISLLFRLLSSQDPMDPISPPLSWQETSIEEAKTIPIGWFEDDGLTPVTAETRRAVQDAARSLERQGFTVRPFRPASLEAARELWWTFFMQCGAMFYAPTIRGREQELSPIFREFLDLGHSKPPLTAESLLQGMGGLRPGARPPACGNARNSDPVDARVRRAGLSAPRTRMDYRRRACQLSRRHALHAVVQPACLAGCGCSRRHVR